MINKIIQGLKNPKQSIKFLNRQIYLQKIRKEYKFNSQLKPQNFEIQKSKLSFKVMEKTIKDADKILAGHLKIYSSVDIKTKKNINWHKDYISNFIWPKNKFYTDIKYDYLIGTDIKNPWEISRFQQMLTIGLAYKKTKNEKYAQYFANQVMNWIEKNPVYYGVNWKCTMEVAIRICNWLVAYDLMRNSKLLQSDSKFYKIFCTSIYEHGKYIFHNLENIGTRSNHYMSDLVGLIWIGIMAPNMKNSRNGLKFGLKEFEKEILHQFYNDGVNFEASTSYHRLVLEMIAYTTLLCKNHKIKLQNKTYKRIQKAFEYSYYYLKPNNHAPQFGDNDSGRFFISKNYFKWQSLNHKGLIKLAKEIFPNIKLIKQLPKDYIKYFLNGQVLILNKWNWYLAITATSLGQDKNGGHNHNDAGSFELSYKGKDFIIDSGTYVYTSNPKERNKFRSIQSHSVFAIKNQEFNQFVLGNLFTLKNSSKPIVKIKKSKNVITIEIIYFNNKLIRTFRINPNCIKIIDTVNNHLNDIFMQNMILSDDIKAHLNKDQVTLSNKNNKLILNMGNPKITSCEISKAYNIKNSSFKISNSFKLKRNEEKIITICQTKK